jgi:hypothetical protein
MPTFLERYMAGEYEQVWDELCSLGPDVRKPLYFDGAVAVAHETMRRVRRNCEILIPCLETLGWRFGYEWARARLTTYQDPEASRAGVEREIAEQPPLLGEPTPAAIVDNIESNNGLIPISLRAFYEVVGAINFVGTPFARPNWPGIEDGLDPLYIAGVAQAFGHERYEYDKKSKVSRAIDMGDALVTPWPGRVKIAPDFLHKYFISGVGSLYTEIPAEDADATIMFEDAPLVVEDRNLTLVRYLRYSMQGGGFLAFMLGIERDEKDQKPEEDLAYLTEGLWSI